MGVVRAGSERGTVSVDVGRVVDCLRVVVGGEDVGWNCEVGGGCGGGDCAIMLKTKASCTNVGGHGCCR